MEKWVKAHAPALARKPTAFVSVCLGVLQHDPKVQHDLQAIVDRFIAVTGWRPAVVKFVAGALDTGRDYEYTDWNDLRHFAADFGRGLSASTNQAAVR